MGDEAVVGLVKDLAARLSTIAVEFGDRADRLAGTGTTPAAASPRSSGRDLAQRLLAQRVARFDFFPGELFHEPAWDMLLALYVADEDGENMNVKTLVSRANAPVTTSQRWIDHLHKLRLVDRVVDPADRRRIEISLSATGRESVARYLHRLDVG